MNDNSFKVKNKILYICKTEYNYFLSKKNIVGLGLGYKIVKGFNTKELCITIFARKKLSYDKLKINDCVPKLYKGIKTDIIESGTMKSFSLNTRVRPVPGGYSVGPSKLYANGTLGCLVKTPHDNRYYLLGNSHFFADSGKLPLGTPIVQPSIPDGGVISKDTVGNLSKYIPLKFKTILSTPKNYVDCAIAKVTAQYLVSPKIAFLGAPTGIRPAYLGAHVQKVGRTTEHTIGAITTIGTTILAEYPHGDCLFLNQISTTSMASDGDSGSILLDTTLNVLGLLICGTDVITFYNPIASVLSNLNVEIATQ